MTINLQRLNPYSTLAFVIFFTVAAAAKEDYLLPPHLHAALTEIHRHIENDEHISALQKLNKLIRNEKLTDYDSAVIYQTLGFVEHGLGNDKNSAEHFIKSLSYKALPANVAHELRYSTAQLLIQTGNPKAGLNYLSRWFSDEQNPEAQAHILASTAYYQLKNYKALIPYAEQAISLSSHAPLNWYELLLAAYYATKKYKSAASLLEKMIGNHPGKTNYWLQLVSVYRGLKQDQKALAVFELAYKNNLLDKEKILQLADNYLQLEMPYKAALLLETELAAGNIEINKKNLALLADSWLLAQEREKAKPVFERIIKQYNDANSRLRLAQLLVETEAWEHVIKLLAVKLNTNDRRFLSKANLLLGIAEYHSNNYTEATRAFTHALTDQATADRARWWLEHLKKTSSQHRG